MDRVSQAFHRNVQILTKFVPPTEEFKKHFKEGMFDKPNTTGFIHVSHYLLGVYYKDSLKSKIEWPIVDKQSENKFRNDVKDCLQSIARSHENMNFPQILASHLILAKGTKFLLIMWKLSIVTLSTFLKRDQFAVLLNPLKSGSCQEVTRKFIMNVTESNHNIVRELQTEKKVVEKKAKDMENKHSKIQADLKAKILSLKENLKIVAENAPVNDAARKCLMDIEDSEIINMWTDSINQNLEQIREEIKKLKEIYSLLKKISHIVLNLTGKSEILGAGLGKVDVDLLYKTLPPDKQILACHLYSENDLNILNFFRVLLQLFWKYNKTNRQRVKVDDSSKCQLQLQTSIEDLKQLLHHYQATVQSVVDFTTTSLQHYSVKSDLQEVFPNMMELKEVLFMPSPKININDFDNQLQDNQNNLNLTPIENSHRELFSRHPPLKKSILLPRKPLPVQRINFDDSLSSQNSNKSIQPTFDHTFMSTTGKSSLKKSDLYARVFSRRGPNIDKVNNSMMMMMSITGSSMLPMMKQHCYTLDSCNTTQDFSADALLMKPNMNSTVEIPKQNEKPVDPPSVARRRSISDLVARYKKIVEKSNNSVVQSDTNKNVIDVEENCTSEEQ